MSRMSTSRSTTESESMTSMKSKVDRYAAKIVSLQSENIKLNNENQLLAQKFNGLTEYNQTLGNDLANFDEEIVFLEQQISQKTTEFQLLSRKADNLDKQIKSCRKALLDDADFNQAANKLKKLEEKKKAVLKKLSELKGDSINEGDPGILETRALLLEEVKLLEKTNSDLMQEKSLLQILIDTDKTVAQKKATLEEMIKKKEKEQNKLLDEIQTLRQNTPQEISKMLQMSVLSSASQTNSEYADDEENEQEANKKNKTNDQSIEIEEEEEENQNDEKIENQPSAKSKDPDGNESLDDKEQKSEAKKDSLSDKNSSISEKNEDEAKKEKKSHHKKPNSISESENEGKEKRKKKKRSSSVKSQSHKSLSDYSDDSDENKNRRRKRNRNKDRKGNENEDESDNSDDDLDKSHSRRKRHHSNKDRRRKHKNADSDSGYENDIDDDQKDNDNLKSKEKSRKHKKRAASESRRKKKSYKTSDNDSDSNNKDNDTLSDAQRKSSRRHKRSNKENSKSIDDYSDNYDNYADNDYNDNEDSFDSLQRHKHGGDAKKSHKRNKSPSKKDKDDVKSKSNSKKKASKAADPSKNINTDLNEPDNKDQAKNQSSSHQQSKKQSQLQKVLNNASALLSSQPPNSTENQKQGQASKTNPAKPNNLAIPSGSADISAFASVRRKVKKPSVELVDAEAQTNEAEINPVFKGLDSNVSDREQEALSKLDSLKKEIESKLSEKNELQAKLNKPRPKFTMSDKLSVSLSPLPDAIHDLSLTLFSHHSRGIQTDVSGETIDFHTRLLESQVSEMSVASDLQEEIQNLQKQITTVNESITQAKQEGETRDQQIKKVKEDLKKAKQNIESEQQNQDLETRMKNEIMNEISNLKVEIREKQGELETQTERNQQMQEKLDELIKVRQSLERDIEDMSMREKPEIQTLSQQVHTYSGRVKEAELKLKKAEEDLEEKREILINLKKSDEMKNYKDLSIKKLKLERRLNKWKLLLKDSRETMQSLEAFSRQNFQKRQYLAQQLEKYEREKADKEEELRDLEGYSALLSALLQEQNENWS